MCPYYAGDYYAGDPGLFGFLRRAAGGFGLVKKAFPRVAQTALAVIPGGGAIARAGAALSRAATMGKMVVRAHPVGTAVAGAVASAGAMAAVSHRPSPVAAGMAMMGAPGAAPEGMPMRGFHVIRKGPHAGLLTRNRRMRVTNPRALRRAIRRATGFARLARRVLHFTSPRAPRGRALFRARRRTKRV